MNGRGVYGLQEGAAISYWARIPGGYTSMTDNVSTCRRSEIMRNIKPKNTLPEVLVRSSLHRMGYRFRLHVEGLAGHPDIVFPKRRKIIFVHGCFWHSHKNCKKAALPKSNMVFWKEKITRNKARDKRNLRDLKRSGWQVMTVWQCDLRRLGTLQAALRDFLDN